MVRESVVSTPNSTARRGTLGVGVEELQEADHETEVQDVTGKTQRLISWVTSQLYDACNAFDPDGKSRPQDVALFASVILRKLSQDVESWIIVKVNDPNEIEIARGIIH